MHSVSQALKQDGEIEWVDENTVLSPEDTSDRSKLRQGKRELRVAYAFSFWRDKSITTVFPETDQKHSNFQGLKLRATVASLNGPARDLVQAGALHIEFSCMDIAPMCIEQIIDIQVDSHRCFRNAQSALCVITQCYQYFLLGPEDFYRHTWTECVSKWEAAKHLNLRVFELSPNDERPCWWSVMRAWRAFKQYSVPEEINHPERKGKGKAGHITSKGDGCNGSTTKASGKAHRQDRKRKAPSDNDSTEPVSTRSVRCKERPAGIRRPLDRDTLEIYSTKVSNTIILVTATSPSRQETSPASNSPQSPYPSTPQLCAVLGDTPPLPALECSSISSPLPQNTLSAAVSPPVITPSVPASALSSPSFKQAVDSAPNLTIPKDFGGLDMPEMATRQQSLELPTQERALMDIWTLPSDAEIEAEEQGDIFLGK